MADAYKIKADTSIKRTLRRVVNLEGVEIEESTGQAFREGEYVLTAEMTQRDQQRAENGELDHLLEPVELSEAEAARQAITTGLFIPEHEVERVALLDAGHQVVERSQVLDLRSAGAEAARAALEASRTSPNDANPNVTENPSFVEVPDLATSQTDGEVPTPKDTDDVDLTEIEDKGVEMPPGLPVGNTLAKAEGADPDEVDEKSKPTPRAKPGSGSKPETTEKKTDGQS